MHFIWYAWHNIKISKIAFQLINGLNACSQSNWFIQLIQVNVMPTTIQNSNKIQNKEKKTT